MSPSSSPPPPSTSSQPSPPISLPDGYTISHAVPSAETYLRLRAESGLKPAFSAEAAEKGLPNTLFAVQVMHHEAGGEESAVGMGRITGDRGLVFLVTDICTLPAHRGRGLASAVMAALMRWLRAHAPASAWVELSADEGARGLYKRFGFRETEEEWRSVGMSVSM